jgi:hypothetical protein
MKVIRLSWISKKALEAELIVGDDVHRCLVFSQPCDVKENQLLTSPLHALDVANLMRVIDNDKKENIVKIDESYFSHYCIATIINMQDSIVSVGDILIELENGIPDWAKEGDLIEFKCSRLDIW